MLAEQVCLAKPDRAMAQGLAPALAELKNEEKKHGN